MRIAKRLVATAVAAAMLGGCASSGGSGDGESAEFVRALFCAALMLPPDCGGSAQEPPGGQSGFVPYVPTPFTKWSDRIDQPWDNLEAASLETTVPYEHVGSVRVTAAPAFDGDAKTMVRDWHVAYLEYFHSLHVDLHGYGRPGIFVFPERPDLEILRAFGTQLQTAFADEPHRSIGLVANPYALGWDYQSFGAWSSAQDPAALLMGATSVGAPTLAASVPASGTAGFTGKLAGLYVAPDGAGSMAAADLVVNANFSARSLSFTSNGTTIARDVTTALAAPHLDLAGTVTYAPGANAFAGTLANAGGTISGPSNGRFYGPAAQELGGVFTLKSATTAEALTGAYGAKR